MHKQWIHGLAGIGAALCLGSTGAQGEVLRHVDECDSFYGADVICAYELTELEVTEFQFLPPLPHSERDDIFAAPNPIDWTKIINIGKAIWEIIKENRPVVDTSYTAANALPGGVSRWTDLAGWQTPMMRRFSANYKNSFGINVVTYDFAVISVWGGHAAGRGRYLADVRVIPQHIDVFAGFSLNAKAEVAAVFNVGTYDNPVAGMTLQHNWIVKTALQEARDGEVFFIRGDGTIARVGD